MNGIVTEQQASGHTVLAEADGGAYQSLRQRPVTRAERYALGKSLRKRVPRRSLADWEPPSDRPDPIQQIMVSHQGRADRLVPVRVGRMIASPYGFLRGTAVVMAEDVARLPSTGITPVVCGDSHLGNFGFYASPERDLVIDLNDFDEAHPGGRRLTDLRGSGGSAAGQGTRPNQRRLDDLGLHGPLRSSGHALCAFARRYADQTEADHAALVAAVDRGVLPVERGV